MTRREAAGLGDRHPGGGRRFAARARSDVLVVVQARGQHVVEAVSGHLGEVVLADEAPVGDKGDRPTPKRAAGPPSRRRARDVRGVAGKDVMGDRDAVGGDEEADDDLRPVDAVIAAVAKGEGRKVPPVCVLVSRNSSR